MFCFNGDCYVLDSNLNFSRDELLNLKKEIIERCSVIIHHDYESTCGPDTRDNLKIRNFVKFCVSKTSLKDESKVYRYIYEEYRFPYLIYLIDHLLIGDYFVISELINIDYEKEIISYDEVVRKVSHELDSISNYDIREKRLKLDELEKCLEQLKYNKRQVSVIPYYQRVLDIIGVKKNDILESDEVCSLKLVAGI